MLGFCRKLRAKSALVKAIHPCLREPSYRALEFAYRNGVSMEFRTGDPFRIQPRFLGMSLFQYETDLIHIFSRIIVSGMTVTDVGAQVGIYTLLVSRKVGPSGKVIAIEPSPAIAQLLRQHLSANLCN